MNSDPFSELTRIRDNSDKGSQYTSSNFHQALQRHDMVASVGRTGVCWDNSLAESFFAALKNQRLYRTVYPTKATPNGMWSITSKASTILAGGIPH
jgi:transposase InsO family protein